MRLVISQRYHLASRLTVRPRRLPSWGSCLLYESQMLDSRNAAWQTMTSADGSPLPGRAASPSAPPPTAKAPRRRRASACAPASPRPIRTLLPVGSVLTSPPATSLQRRLHGDGYRPEGAGPSARSLHVELPRGAEVRPQGRPGHGAAARMGSDAPARRRSSIACSAARGRSARAAADQSLPRPQASPAGEDDHRPSCRQ